MTPELAFGVIEPLGLRGWCYQCTCVMRGRVYVMAVRDDGRGAEAFGTTKDDAVASLRALVCREFPGTEIIAPF